jgi:hypothetical protein
MPTYKIAGARPCDLHSVAAIELAGAQLLKGHAPVTVLNEITDEQQLREAQSRSRLWVPLTDDTPDSRTSRYTSPPQRTLKRSTSIPITVVEALAPGS